MELAEVAPPPLSLSRRLPGTPFPGNGDLACLTRFASVLEFRVAGLLSQFHGWFA